jgi:hypothetical protein
MPHRQMRIMPSEANKQAASRHPGRLSVKQRRKLERGKAVIVGINPDKSGRRIKETFPDVDFV